MNTTPIKSSIPENFKLSTNWLVFLPKKLHESYEMWESKN